MAGEILVLDLGTTHCRAAVYDPTGNRLAFAGRGIPIVTDAEGRAEQDAEGVWIAALDLLREAVARAGIREAVALSFSVQGDAVIPLSRDGRPLHPALLGMDYRPLAQAREVQRRLGGRRVFRHTGIRPHPIAAACKMLWLCENRPAVTEHAWKLATYSDYLLARLGGEPAMDHTMASRTMLYDLRGSRWSPWLLGRLGISEDLLSRVVSAGQPVGALRTDVAQEIGLAKPPLLVAGAHDQVCAALGCGVPNRGRCVLSSGSAEVLSVAFDRPLLTGAMYRAHYPCYRFATPGTYFTFSLNHAAGLLLQWFHENLASGEQGEGGWGRVFGGLGDGPSPVLVLPHWLGSGTPVWDPQSRGAMLGMTLGTTRGDLALALLESLCYELRINVETMERAGLEIREVAVTGGGVATPEDVQRRADILGRPLCRAETPEAAALGAAILAATGGGLYDTIPEAIDAMVRRGAVVEPRPERTRAHEARFRLYRELYPRLAPIARRLS